MTDSLACTDKRSMSAGWVRKRSLEEISTEGKIVPFASAPSLAALYTEHFRYVWRCFRSLGVRDHELDDAIQDLFLVVKDKLSEFDGRCATKTWLYAIALRIARRYRERRVRAWRRDAPNDSVTELVAPRHDIEQQLEHDERLSVATSALQSLDDDKREVFVLSQVEQMSAPEIAEILSIPVNTVYSRLRAARLAFASAIERHEARSRRQP
jgi:RNA polymerase sigma-70 factor, ECF subfamily